MMKHLNRDLEKLKREILTAGSLVEEALEKATRALIDRREDLAEEVIQGDRAIDDKEIEIEEECLKILALHQPVAADLRFIIAIMKVNNDLERIGDLAANIAKRSLYLMRKEPLHVPEEFGDMISATASMVTRSLNSLVTLDTALAREVCQDDSRVDEANRRMFELMQDDMMDSPDLVKRAVNTLSISRHLERIADLATNIAEDVVFMVDGDVIRHGRYAQSKPGE
jgi:phosphate transport system protein